MHYLIVPLSGPDFYDVELGVKSLQLFNGAPVVVQALRSRPWAHYRRRKLIFVLTKFPQIDVYLRFIRDEFPAADVVVLPRSTQGPIMSAVAAASLISDLHAPICVDLADMLFKSIEHDPFTLFEEDRALAGSIAFGLLEPISSGGAPTAGDLQIANRAVQWASDSRAISSYGAVGTYFFRNLKVLMKAATVSTFRNGHCEQGNPLSITSSFSSLINEHTWVRGLEVQGIRTFGKDRLRFASAGQIIGERSAKDKPSVIEFTDESATTTTGRNELTRAA